MIALASDFLIFRLANGECAPFSADMISIHVLGDTARWFDADYLSHAAKGVFHYFKHELNRQIVTVNEFAGALEKVLRGFKAEMLTTAGAGLQLDIGEADLCSLAHEAGGGCELIFFPRLRHELQEQLRRSPRVLHFHGLRACVKQLTGARRWTRRCGDLAEQIVSFLRGCLETDGRPVEVALLVR